MKYLFTSAKALLLIPFTLWVTSLSAQTNIATTIGSYNSSTCAVGDTIVLPVSVNMASGISISAIALTIDFDNTKLLCIPTAPNSGVYATQVHSMVAAGFLSNVTFFPNQNPNPPYSASTRNQFRAVWFNLVPVAFNGIMFNLRFVVLSTGSSTVKWDLATPGNCEYADELAELISNCEFTDGNITCGSAAIGPCAPLNASITPSGPTSFCQGDSVTLEAYISAGLTYQWRNNGINIPAATNSTINVTNSGSYSVLITDGATCSSLLGPLPVTVIPNPNPNVFSADSLFHCGDSVVLDAGAGYTRYTWSSGDTTQTKAVRSTGWHRVRVYNGLCSLEDSVFVSINDIKALARDSVICTGSPTLISINEGRQPLVNNNTYFSVRLTVNMSQYLDPIAPNGMRIGGNLGNVGGSINGIPMTTWNPMSPECALQPLSNSLWTTEVVFPVSALGSTVQFKFVNGNWGRNEVSQILSGCGLPDGWGSFNRAITLQRGMDLVYCYESCLDCDGSIAQQNVPSGIVWSTGDTTSTITVSPTQTTTYFVTVSNGIHSCVDSVTVTVIPNPLNPNLFAVDSLFHCGDSLVLDAGTGYTRYEWSSGDTTQIKAVRSTGWHRVRAYDGLCSVEDSVFVSLISAAIGNNDTTICSGSSLKINMRSTYYSKSTEFVANQYYDYDDFEGGPGSSDDWSERNGVDPQIVSNTSFKGNNSLYFNNGWGRNFELQTEIGQPYGGYFTADYPFISMAYKIPPGSFTSMLVHIAGLGWRGIAFTQGEQLGCYGPKVGSWNENDTLVRNNQWHFKTINLHDQLQQSLGSGNYKIESIIFHDACTTIPTQGEMWIDDFMITRLEPITSYSSVSWSNGDTTSSITVSPTQTTTYYVTVSNGIHSCVDSVTVNVIPNPLNPNIFAADTLFHCGDSLVLDAGTGYTRYEWSSGDTTQTKTARYTGWHRVRVFDGLCSVEDSVFVSIISHIIEQNDTTICSGSSIELNLQGRGIHGSLRNGLVGYWPFNGNANDESGNSHQTSLNNTSFGNDRFGALYQSLSVGDKHGLMQTPLFPQNEITFSFWYFFNGTGGHWNTLAGRNGGDYHHLLIEPSSYQIGFYNNGFYTSGYGLNIGNWYNIICTKSGNQHRLWLNGVMIQDVNSSFANSQFPLSVLGNAGIGWGQGSLGYFDDFIIWNRALTPSEIQALYNSANGASVSWSTGDTTSSITVSPMQTTTYYVTISNGIHSCVDSVTVNVIPNTLNTNLFSVDSLFHCGDSLVLDAGTGYTRYEWSSGDTTQTKTVRYTGWHRVRVYDGLCSVEDSVFVSIISQLIEQSDTMICSGSSIELNLQASGINGSLRNGLVGYWPFNGNANDVSGNGNHGAVNGATLTTDRFGNQNSAYLFQGNESISTSINGFPIGNAPRTISVWGFPTNIDGQFRMLFGYGVYNFSNHFAFGIYQISNTFFFSSHSLDILSIVPSANQIYHIVVSFDGNILKIYLNGNLTASGPILVNTIPDTFFIGRDGTSFGGHFIGKLDDIGIWNRALTPSEIQALYNSANGASVSWSTGDTTSSITVSPTQTTTYYVTISNGIHSCVDSVTVRVTPKVFVPDMAVCQGDTISVPIIASSLDSVAAISLALNYNQQAMTYVGYTRLRPDMVSTTSIGTAPGQVRLGWFGLSPLISTGPDTLVYYRFVVNQPGGFNWNTQVQGDCELADLDLNILDYCFEGGNLILIDTVNILSSSQGPFEVEIGASIPLSVQSTGATSLQWQRWNPQQGVWTNLQNNADYAGAESGTLTYTCNTYQRPFPLFRLQLSNGCRNWYGPAMQLSLKQRITISVGQFTACQGDTVEVPLTVTGARELGAVSLTLGFNPGAVQFVDWINAAASTQSNIWLSNQVGNEIRLAWFSLISANIPDGNALGTLRIVVTNSTPLTWDLVTPGNCEFGDEDAETIPAQFVSGNLTVNSLPTVNLGISSPFICPNAGSATLSTISDPNYTYAWYFNGQILPNSSDHSITTNLAGTYQVLVTNSSGCMRWSSLQTLGHYPLPNPVITATGSTTTCNQPVSLSVNSTQGGVVEYRWFLNGTLLSTTPSNQWVATVSGSYSVQAIDIGTGCSAWSSAMAVAINPLPNPVITFNGSSTFCLGDSLLLNIPNLSGHLYQWNSGSLPIPGATSASLMVRQGGQYTVQVTNEFACQNLSSPVTITTQNCNALSGVLSYNNTANTVLRNSKVYLALQNGSLVDSSATNNSGQYSIAGYSNNLYQIRATSSINWGGVNATDALGTVRHYTNVVPITGLRLKAADVNGSNSVNNTDALLITRRYSNLLSGFNVGNWASENISIQAAGTPLTQNLKAICYGDINGSYNPSLVRLAPKITVLSSGLVYTEKHVVRWPLYAADNQVLGAVSLVMGIPQGLELVAVQSYMPNGHMEFGQNADELRVGWFSQEGVQTSVGQHLFDLVLRISDEQRSEWTPQEWEMRGLSELADYWATPYEFGRLSMPSISRIRESLVTSKDLLAIPNPSSGDTKLQWTLSAPVEHAYVRVVDALGRVVMEENLGTLEEGSHTLDLPSAGWALGSYGAQLLYTSQDGRSNRLGTILKRIR